MHRARGGHRGVGRPMLQALFIGRGSDGLRRYLAGAWAQGAARGHVPHRFRNNQDLQHAPIHETDGSLMGAAGLTAGTRRSAACSTGAGALGREKSGRTTHGRVPVRAGRRGQKDPGGSGVVLSCEAAAGAARQALDAGAAVETMHDFTLVHDDIMDNADSRRGRPTVHTRWDVNTALLVGDVLLGLAYRACSGAERRRPRRCSAASLGGLWRCARGRRSTWSSRGGAT